MATNQDFSTLINRVEVATEQLEESVEVITTSVGDVDDKVALAEGFAQQALASSTEASLSSATATQQANLANQAKQDTENLLDTFKGEKVVGEAPKNGQQFVRKDGAWAMLETETGGGGTVASVNGILPDETGDVTVVIPQQVQPDWNAEEGLGSIKNKPVLFDGSYTSLSDKPTIPSTTEDLTNTSGFIPDAPNDGKQWARQNNSWSEVVAGGGGSGGAFPTGGNVLYDGENFEQWVSENPYTQAQLSLLYKLVGGRPKLGIELFANQSTVDDIPDGAYWFTESDVSSSELSGLYGVIYKSKWNTHAIAIDRDSKTPTLYSFSPSSSTSTLGTWTASGGGGGASQALGYELNNVESSYFKYNGVTGLTHFPVPRGEYINLGDCAFNVGTASRPIWVDGRTAAEMGTEFGGFNELFTWSRLFTAIPAGLYLFKSGDFVKENPDKANSKDFYLNNKSGVMVVEDLSRTPTSSSKQIVFYTKTSITSSSGAVAPFESNGKLHRLWTYGTAV